jgi:uncharacterized protein (TIGR03086 family)
MATDRLELAFTLTRGILTGVTRDQLDGPTPCASWDVRNLVSHIIGGSYWFADTIATGVADPFPTRDYTAGDLVASYDEGIRASLAGFGAPGALEAIIRLPFGEFPCARYMTLATTDTFVHGWDLARATGQPSDLDSSLALELLDISRQSMNDAFRGPDGQAAFGPLVEIPDTAPAADRLAAFLGRHP